MSTSARSAAAERRRRKVLGALNGIAVYGLLLALSAAILMPFLWLLTSTLRPVAELYTYPPRWLPSHVTLAAYGKALRTFAVPLTNSVSYSLITAVLSLAVACPAAYSLARYRYRGKQGVTYGLLITQMLPFVLLLLPLYIAYVRLGLYNTRLGMIIAFTGLTVPYSVLLLRSYFISLPKDLEDQAMIDGCTRVAALWHVVLPLSAPVLIAVVVSNVVLVWNDVLFTIFLTKDLEVQTASVALYRLFTLRGASGGVAQREVLLAGGVLLTLPIVVLFTFLQKYVTRGLTLGALKA